MHHAIDFCRSTHVVCTVDNTNKRRCVGCGVWTIHRAAFVKCPYEDVLAVCPNCFARPHLTNKHMERRDLLDLYAHHLELSDGKQRPANAVTDTGQFVEAV